ncbi:MAG: hypothetical protein ABSE39_10215 [Candidatus Bathyarchaeia archaeon]
MPNRTASTVIFADKTFFDLSMRVDSGLHILDIIQSSLAKVSTTTKVTEALDHEIDRLLRPPLDAIWRRNMSELRRDYMILLSIRDDPLKASDEIRSISSMISKALNQFNRRVDQMELEVLAAASWLRRNSETEVLVVSDDSDVLLACHLLSSFLGLVPSVLSSFELLRLSSGNQYVGEVCDYFSMDAPVSRYDTSLASTSLNEVDRIAHKGFLSIHTKLRPHDSVLRMACRSRSRSV